MDVKNDSEEIFNNLSSKITHLFYERTEGDWEIIGQALEKLNSLNYKYPIVHNTTKAILLIHQCCSFIPVDDALLIPKCCKLLTNLINFQSIVLEERTLKVVLKWCLEILELNKIGVAVQVLITMEAVIRSSSRNSHCFLKEVVVKNGPVLNLAKSSSTPEIAKLALQCVVACTIVSSELRGNDQSSDLDHLDVCSDLFLSYLVDYECQDEVLYISILIICFQGLNNILIQSNRYLRSKVGIFLGIIKSYMLFGVQNIEHLKPQNLLPATLSIPEATSVNRIKKGGKIAKQRKPKRNKIEVKKPDAWTKYTDNSASCAVSSLFDFNLDSTTNTTALFNKLNTSDSDFSDSESGKLAKISRIQSTLRQAALCLFLNTIKNLEKNTMFSYWSSFIPENALCGKHNLLRCVLDDPVPRCRIAALNVLLQLLLSSKLFLAQAESSNHCAAFTPFSVIVGYTIKELHTSLSLALNENMELVSVQVLRCYAALVQATPYHRLDIGLITSVLRSLKSYIYHKDANVQVGALIVVGCILTSEPIVSETKEVLLKNKQDVVHINTSNKNNQTTAEDFVYAEFPSEDEIEDSDPNERIKILPWILEKCLFNLGYSVTGIKDEENYVPVSVKGESVKLLAAMCANYFDSFILPYLTLIARALNDALADKYTDLKLHAGRTVDSIGQSMQRHFDIQGLHDDESTENGLLFWQTLLLGALTSLFQSEQYALVRAVACDCLGSIGPHIFGHLPDDKQILYVTLLFACSRDDERRVKAAAIRALGISVLYPTLRKDPGFVVDTTEAVYRILKEPEENLEVRIKASWALGNLSDTLVLNSLSDLREELPTSLLLKLLQVSIQASSDNDKIKMSTVRALGNLLQLINLDLMAMSELREVVHLSIHCLIKHSVSGAHMKVRWNSCYAIGNALKNQNLFDDCGTWQSVMFNALSNLVINCKNFKVRINAALALGSPSKREFYGNMFLSTWISLMKALENSQNMEDFTEFKHRDQLIEQVCLTMGHLITLLTIEDLHSINDCLTSNYDMLKLHVHRAYELLIPEKSNILFSAASSLRSFSHEDTKADATHALNLLKDIFVHEL